MNRLGPVRRAALSALLAMSFGIAAGSAEAQPGTGSVTTLVRSAVWVGYGVVAPVHEVTARWTEPEAVCTSSGSLQRVSTWIGLNGDLAADGRIALPLMQTGASSICLSEAAAIAHYPGRALDNLAGITNGDSTLYGAIMHSQARLNEAASRMTEGLCTATRSRDLCTPHLYRSAWWEAYPAVPQNYGGAVSAHPGDRMKARVALDHGNYVMTLTDWTQHWTRTVSQPAHAPAATAEIIIEGHLTAAMPRFTPITFTDVTIDGRPLAAVPNLRKYVLCTTSGTLEPSPVTPAGFTIGTVSDAGCRKGSG